MNYALCIMHLPSPYYSTKSNYVVDTIRTAILVGDLLPGQRITEQQFKDLLKVSSSPIREAFNQLEVEGLLTKIPHVGTTVTEINVEDAKELYFIQSLLQAAAVQISAKKLHEQDIREAELINNEMRAIAQKRRKDIKGLRVLNYKLHMILCGSSIFPWLTRLISGLWIRLPTQSLWLLPHRPQTSIRQHEKILDAVRKQDSKTAGIQMRKHLESSMKALYGPYSNP